MSSIDPSQRRPQGAPPATPPPPVSKATPPAVTPPATPLLAPTPFAGEAGASRSAPTTPAATPLSANPEPAAAKPVPINDVTLLEQMQLHVPRQQSVDGVNGPNQQQLLPPQGGPTGHGDGPTDPAAVHPGGTDNVGPAAPPGLGVLGRPGAAAAPGPLPRLGAGAAPAEGGLGTALPGSLAEYALSGGSRVALPGLGRGDGLGESGSQPAPRGDGARPGRVSAEAEAQITGLGARSPLTLASMMQASAAASPMFANIAADIFRMQTARLEQLYAGRSVDDDGELPPMDEDEARMRQVRIGEVELPGGMDFSLGAEEAAAAAEEEEDAEAAALLPFAAALLAVSLQAPEALTAMFRLDPLSPAMRLYRRQAGGRLTASWVAAAPTTDDWVALGQSAYLAHLEGARPERSPSGRARAAARALEAICGRPALSLDVVPGSVADGHALWRLLARTGAPRLAPVLCATGTEAGLDGLAAGHVYGVLGAFRRQGVAYVSTCSPSGGDAFGPARSVAAVPFAILRRHVEAVALLHGVR